uniref:Uncharacterized protein n=2 Tax=viral metagenome TaxID=1070528 RepID=A0A6M3J7N5_9ZZZZ
MKAIIEINVTIAEDGFSPIPDIPPSSSGDDGLMYYDEGGNLCGGRNGPIEGELTKLVGHINAGELEGLKSLVKIDTSEEKLIAFHNAGKFRVVSFECDDPVHKTEIEGKLA